jgi:hypothetical protein
MFKSNTNEKHLITTDQWFIAPDGEQYRAVWGEAKDQQSANGERRWIVVGEEVALDPSQINYSVRCPDAPLIKEGSYKEKNTQEELAYNKIYIPLKYRG